jgi:hypothetical protein
MIDRVRSLFRELGPELAERVDAEAEAHRRASTPGAVHRRTAFVFVVAALSLMFVRFAGNEDDPKWLVSLLDGVGLDAAATKLQWAMSKSPDKRLYQRVYWAVARLVGYGVIPGLATVLVLRERLRDYGLGLGTLRKHAWLYPVFLGIVAPFVVIASYGAAFQARYPYYKLQPGEPLWPGLVAWELLYASQFIALELFFRGFIVHGLRKTIGYAAVFAPIVPYAMIHFGKPLPEAIGSIVTGFVLGTMCLESRSIWGGAFVHVSVACGMDLLSLWQRGLL